MTALQLPTERYLTPEQELRTRVAALQHRLRDAEVAAAVIVQATSMFYFAGSIASGWLVVPAEGEPQLHVRRAARRVQAETCWPVTRTVATRELARAVPVGRVGAELDTMPVTEYRKLTGALGVEIVDIGHEVRSVRAVKSAWELHWMREAAEQVRTAMQAVVEQVRAGWREIDVALLAEGVLREAGHQGVIRMRRFNGEMFYGQVAAAANAALPAALDAPLGGAGRYPSVGKGASERVLRRGELLVLDLMGAANGYLSDCTRVVAIGGTEEVDEDLLHAQQWCVDVLGELASLARPGVAAAALHVRALGLAAEAGHAERFMGQAPDQARFVGHGVGLEVDEYPFLAPGYEMPLEPGMVFALEPKLVFGGRAAVGIEDTFVVGEHGVDALPAVGRGVLEARA